MVESCSERAGDVGSWKLNAVDELAMTVVVNVNVRDLAGALAMSPWDPTRDLTAHNALRLIRPEVAKYGTNVQAAWADRRRQLAEDEGPAVVVAFEQRWNAARVVVDRLFR